MPDDSVDELLGGDATAAERELLRRKVSKGPPKDLEARVPDAPDVSPSPGWRGLSLLRPGELPEPGKHYVVWGSEYLGDVRERAVAGQAPLTEDAYAQEARAAADAVTAGGVKDPPVWSDPRTRRSVAKGSPGAILWRRADRAEAYARWRYRGYVCGEIVSL